VVVFAVELPASHARAFVREGGLPVKRGGARVAAVYGKLDALEPCRTRLLDRRTQQARAYALSAIVRQQAHAEMADMGVDGNGLAPDVAPAYDMPAVVGHELRIAQPQVARDERGRLLDRKTFDKRQEPAFAHDRVGHALELSDVGERDRPDDDVGHAPLAATSLSSRPERALPRE